MHIAQPCLREHKLIGFILNDSRFRGMTGFWCYGFSFLKNTDIHKTTVILAKASVIGTEYIVFPESLGNATPKSARVTSA